MLNIQNVEHLIQNLAVSNDDFYLGVEFADEDVTELRVWDPRVDKKPREVIAVGGRFRLLQERLRKRILSTKLKPSPASHGSVNGRSIVSNARIHIGNRFLFKADIGNFFPSIHSAQVNRMFMSRLRCSPEVSRYLTRICTYDRHLALGLVTSPILADQVLSNVDLRLQSFCEKRNLRYTRYVDDIAISAAYDLQETKISEIIEEIFHDHGFSLKYKDDDKFLRINDSKTTITKIRIKKKRLDVAKEYALELERQLDDHIELAADRDFAGPLFSSSQLAGKVYFVCWVNPGRRLRLVRKLRSIRWDQLWSNARTRGLVYQERKITLRNEPRPSSDAFSPQATERIAFESETMQTGSPNDAPF